MTENTDMCLDDVLLYAQSLDAGDLSVMMREVERVFASKMFGYEITPSDRTSRREMLFEKAANSINEEWVPSRDDLSVSAWAAMMETIDPYKDSLEKLADRLRYARECSENDSEPDLRGIASWFVSLEHLGE